jgi:hypothetical protein
VSAGAGSSDGQAVLPANYTFTSTDAGVHSFSGTLRTAGSQSITATDTATSSIKGGQSGITVSPAAISGLQVTASRSVTAGQAFTITVTAVDPFSNVINSYLGTVHFTSSDNQAILPGNYTFKAADGGVHVFTSGVTLKTVSAQTVIAMDTVTSALTGQAAITVNSGTLTPALFGRVSSTGQVWGAVSKGTTAFTNRLWATMSTGVTWVDVLTGDFNGDGKTDIVARAAESGDIWVGLSTGSTFQFSRWTTWSTAVSWVDARVGDFKGDGKADLAGRVLQTGQWWVAQSTGSSFSNRLWTTWSTGVSWTGVSVGDFNGDGKDDIAGMAANGQWWLAQSNGSAFSNAMWATWSTGVTWVDIQVGDFNGDGKADLTGRALQTGQWWTVCPPVPCSPPVCGRAGARASHGWTLEWVTSTATARRTSWAAPRRSVSGGWVSPPAPRSVLLFGPHGARVSPGLIFKWEISTATARTTLPAERCKTANGGRVCRWGRPSTPPCGPLGLRAPAGRTCA